MQTLEETFTSSLFYEVELTARYFKFLAIQLFEKFEIDMPIDNFAILDILTYTHELCQRDLAKLILKDRANTGKILHNLEKDGFIKRFVDIKSNRLVKKIKLTKKGILFAEKVNEKFKDIKMLLEERILIEEKNRIIKSLTKVREFLKENVETKI